MSLFLYIYDRKDKELPRLTIDRIKNQLASSLRTQINEYCENNLQLIYTTPHSECLRIFDVGSKNLVFFLQGSIFESLNGLEKIGPSIAENSLENQIIKRYLSNGIASCTGLNGIYNLIVWNKKLRSLEIVGDRLGVLQLFFAPVGKGEFVLTTDILVLKHLPGYRVKISRRGIFDMLYMGIAFEGRSILENVERLLPNACYRVLNATLTLVDKYKLSFSNKRWTNSSDKILDEFEHYYVQAIKRQLNPKDKIAYFQSGGKDSRVFSYFLKKSGIIPHCFSAGANHHGDVYLAKNTNRELGFPWKKIPAGKDFYPVIAKKSLEIDSFSSRILETWVGEIINQLPLEFNRIITTFFGDIIFGNPIQFGKLEESNDPLCAFTNYFNFARSGFLSPAELKELFPQDAESWITNYHKDAFRVFLDSGNVPFQMLIGYELRTDGRFKIGHFLRKIHSAFCLRAPNLDIDLENFIFSLPQAFLNKRYLLDIFLMQRVKRLGVIHLDQNYRKYKALVPSLVQDLKFNTWHNYVNAFTLPLLKRIDPLSATTQFYIQAFSLRHKGFQEMKDAAFSRINLLEDILNVPKAINIFQKSLPPSKDHITAGNTLRSMITAVMAVDAFN